MRTERTRNTKIDKERKIEKREIDPEQIAGTVALGREKIAQEMRGARPGARATGVSCRKFGLTK